MLNDGNEEYEYGVCVLYPGPGQFVVSYKHFCSRKAFVASLILVVRLGSSKKTAIIRVCELCLLTIPRMRYRTTT